MSRRSPFCVTLPTPVFRIWTLWKRNWDDNVAPKTNADNDVVRHSSENLLIRPQPASVPNVARKLLWESVCVSLYCEVCGCLILTCDWLVDRQTLGYLDRLTDRLIGEKVRTNSKTSPTLPTPPPRPKPRLEHCLLRAQCLSLQHPETHTDILLKTSE